MEDSGRHLVMQWVHLTTMAAVMVAIACGASHGAHYFLSPGGDDGNAGSRDAHGRGEYT